MVFILVLVFIKPPKEQVDNFYGHEKINSAVTQNIKFSDRTQDWGVVYDHFQNSSGENPFSGLVFPSVLIYDFDNNGFVDIFYSGGNRNFLYLNFGNGVFKESAESFGIACFNDTEFLNSQIVMGDLNGDGEDDIYLATSGSHRLFYRDLNSNHFTEVSEKLNGYRSFSHGISLLDFNQDGRLDVVVANFHELGKEYRRMQYVLQAGELNNFGTNNALLIQQPDGSFKNLETLKSKNKTFANSVGISDINNDGYPDIFFANDYGPDSMLMNIEGRSVLDVTTERVPKHRQLNGGKSVEFIDYDQDGLIDLFVTNAYIPPYQAGYNMLWKKTSKDGNFKLVSQEENIGKSGLSWGAKFADFNLDGKLDVYVANGLERDLRGSRIEDEKSLWYGKMEFAEAPLFFRNNSKSFSQNKNNLYHRFGFQRDALFIQGSNNRFYDVALDIGLSDDSEGRGLAIADFNNDGLMDIVVTNYFGKSKVYQNMSKPGTTWIGLKLINSKGSQLPIGTKITLKQSHGPDLVREYYPGNGFRSQSDSRLVLSLAAGSKFTTLEVIWPGHIKKTYESLKENSYNEVRE